MKVFAFLDLQHPPVVWAVVRGQMVSVNQAPHRHAIGFMLARMIEREDNDRLFNEAVIEHVRETRFKHQVSRVQGLYFLRSRADAEALLRNKSDNWPQYISPENLVELELYCAGEPTVVDANWLDSAPMQGSRPGRRGRRPSLHGRPRRSRRINTSNLGWLDRYWAGESTSKPIWEVIANGVAVVPDTSLRLRCSEWLKRESPESEVLMVMARFAGEAAEHAGLIFPGLDVKDGNFRLRYYFDNGFDRGEVVQKIARRNDVGYLGRLMHENKTLKTPDLGKWGCTFRMNIEFDPNLKSIEIPSVHHIKEL